MPRIHPESQICLRLICVRLNTEAGGIRKQSATENGKLIKHEDDIEIVTLNSNL